MRVKITKSQACGTVKAPPSKSMAHRLLICASMAEGVSTIHGISECEDVLATLDCLSAMDIKYEKCKETITLYGKNIKNRTFLSDFKCRESGSTLRFLIPTALVCEGEATFVGASALLKRPMDVYKNLCLEKGLSYEANESGITVKGPLKSGEYTIAGNVSSQFISGLLFALPNLSGDSRIHVLPPIESRPYIDMTIDAMRMFGTQAIWENDNTIYVKGSQKFTAREVSVEGDYSGTAFIEALNLFGSSVKINGLNPSTLQADAVYRDYFELLENGTPTIDISNCPDLGPILFAVAAAKNGATFLGTKRLKIKESDRAVTMTGELEKFGVSYEIYDDSVAIHPTALHVPSEVLNGHNDHRIVMALSVLLTLTGGEIEGAEAISKSYPDFFKDLKLLGIEVDISDV